MKNHQFIGAVSTLLFATVIPSLAATPTISSVTAKQRYPWNGKVDITYTVSGDIGQLVLYVRAEDRANGTTYIASAAALSGDTGTATGAHHIIWDLNAQGLEIKSGNVVFSVAYASPPPAYCVIDLSAGANASSYPVTYLDAPPSGGFNVDAYKTTKLVLRLIEAGSFIMGANQNDESHRVTLTKSFYCGLFEVTQRQWELVMGTRPSFFSNDSCYATRPVEQVSYNKIRGSLNGAQWPTSNVVDTDSFLGKLQVRTGFAFDLPTNAQWEYACRAGTTTHFNNGKNYTNSKTDSAMDEVGRYWYNGGFDGSSSGDYHTGTSTVGRHKPNAWGLYDMHGNVSEWCLDWNGTWAYGVDPLGSSSGASRLLCGGGYSDYALNCTSSSRGWSNPSGAYRGCGFRLVRTLDGSLTIGTISASCGSVAIDSCKGVTNRRADAVPYDSSWVGGNVGATVVITDNGSEVKRAAGTGSVPLSVGRHVMTYTTLIGGTAQPEVYSATVYKCNCALSQGDVPLVESKATKAATCTEDGWTREVKCSRCNAVIESSATIPALGHSLQSVAAVAPTCTENGRAAGVQCSRCGMVADGCEATPSFGGHTGAITKPAVEPTSSTTGKTAEITCTRCGTILQAQTTIPAFGYIRNVTARQLWPSRQVEVAFDVADDIGDVIDAGQTLSLVGQYGSTTIVASHVIGDMAPSPGRHYVIWDFPADKIVVNTSSMTFVVGDDAVDGTGSEVAGNWAGGNATPSAWVASANNALRGRSGTFSGTRYAETGRVSDSDSISRLTDGVVNAAGASYENTYAIKNGTLTWTLSTAVSLAKLRINTHWQDGGRDGVNLSSVQVQKNSSSSWVTLPNSSLSYGMEDNSSGPDLELVYKGSNNGVFARNVTAIRFNLGDQDNNGTGFTEFEAVYGAIVQGAVSGVPINTSGAVDGMNVSGTVNLDYSPFADGTARLYVDNVLIFSSTNSGSFAWQPLTTGSHTLKHISGSYTFTRTVNVTSLATAGTPSPQPPTGTDANISIGTTTRSFGVGGGSGTITTSGSGTWNATASESWITIPAAMTSRNAGLPVVYQVAASAEVEPRTGYIYVSGHVFTITQAGVGAELDAYSADFETEGGTGSFTVLADAQSSWKVRSNVDWISVTTDSEGAVTTSGTGEGAVYFTVAPWNEVSTRSGTITAAGCTFTVNQTGRRMKISGPDIVAAVSGLSASFDYQSHVLAVTVDALSSTEWDVELDGSWLSVVDGGSGHGGGNIAIAINENPSWLARIGSVRIGTETLAIHQEGRPSAALSFSISPATATASVKGANAVISVSATPDLPWTATSQANWLTIMPSFQSGAGNGNVIYTASPNPTMAARTGTIQLAAATSAALPTQTHTVSQPAATAMVSADGHTFAAEGESYGVDVATDDIVNWTIAENISWISVVGATSRIGPGSVSIVAAANMTVDPRSASMTIAGHPFAVVQKGRTVEVEYTARVFGPETDYSTIDVHPDGNVQWTAISSDPSWITVWGDAGCDYDDYGNVLGVGDATLEYIVSDYVGDGTPRTGWIQIGDKTVYITQRPYELTITPSAVTVGGNAGAGTVGVPASAGQIWNAIATEPWITVVSGTDSGTGSGTVRYTYTDNDTGEERTGRIIISGEEYTITQVARQMVAIGVTTRVVTGNGETGTGNGGVVSGFGTYDRGMSVTLAAIANDGYEFVGWTLPDGSAATGASLPVVADVDKELVASFRRIPMFAVNGESVREGTSVTFTAPAPILDAAGTTKLVCAGTSAYPALGTNFTLVITGDIAFEWDLWATNYLVAVEQTTGGRVLRDGVSAVATSVWLPAGSILNLTAVPDTGNSLFRWVVNGETLPTCSTRSTRLKITAPLAISAVFGVFADTLATALDAPTLTFTTGGDADWLPVIDASAQTGYTSARSGAIGPESETWLDTTVEGPGTLTFRWRVDCEKDDGGGATWDRLSVWTNGVEAARLDGTTNWQTVTLPIPAPKTTIRWSFYRDDHDEPGATHENAAWVDGVTFRKEGE